MGDTVKYWSWRNRTVNGLHILPTIKNQDDLHPGSCTMHAVGATTESRKRKTWAETHGTHYPKEASILYLINRLPPPRDPIDVMEFASTEGVMVEPDYSSHVPDDQAEFIEVSDYFERHPIGNQEMQEQLFNELMVNGPFVGSFYWKTDLDETTTTIYDAKGDFLPMTGYPGYEHTYVRHSVCIVGYGTTEENRTYWEYLDSYGEQHLDQGFGKIYTSALDHVIVPIM